MKKLFAILALALASLISCSSSAEPEIIPGITIQDAWVEVIEHINYDDDCVLVLVTGAQVYSDGSGRNVYFDYFNIDYAWMFHICNENILDDGWVYGSGYLVFVNEDSQITWIENDDIYGHEINYSCMNSIRWMKKVWDIIDEEDVNPDELGRDWARLYLGWEDFADREGLSVQFEDWRISINPWD